MKMKPILFSTPMVAAILEGRKTQTRRTVKPQPDSKATLFSYRPDQWPKKPWIAKFKFKEIEGAPYYEVTNDYKCPYGKLGDILYVRETWQLTTWEHPTSENYGYIYKASENGREWEQTEEWKWKPSLFMPKEAARIFLRITDIRVERLQDITEEDAIAEGIEYIVSDLLRGYTDYSTPKGITGVVDSPIQSFRTLWQSINGPESWTANPWAWCVSFERIDKPE